MGAVRMISTHANGAVSGAGDVLRWDAGANELLCVGGPKVEVAVIAGESGIGELLGEFFGDFVAAGSGGGADIGEESESGGFAPISAYLAHGFCADVA